MASPVHLKQGLCFWRIRGRRSGFAGEVSDRKKPRDYLKKWPDPELKPFEGVDPNERAMAGAAVVLAHVAHQLAVARRTKEWTQVTLAKEAGVTSSTISRMESGDFWTDLDVVVRVGLQLGVELDVIWSDSRTSVRTSRERDEG